MWRLLFILENNKDTRQEENRIPLMLTKLENYSSLKFSNNGSGNNFDKVNLCWSQSYSEISGAPLHTETWQWKKTGTLSSCDSMDTTRLCEYHRDSTGSEMTSGVLFHIFESHDIHV